MREQILEYLYAKYNGEKIDISHFLASLVPAHDQKILQSILRNLSDGGLVEFGGLFTEIGNGGYIAPNFDLTAKITANGMSEALANRRIAKMDALTHEQVTSATKTNDSIRSINPVLRVTNILSVIIAAFTGTFIALQYAKESAPIQSQKDKILEQKVRKLDSTQKVKIKTDSLRESLEKKNASVVSVDSSKTK